MSVIRLKEYIIIIFQYSVSLFIIIILNVTPTDREACGVGFWLTPTVVSLIWAGQHVGLARVCACLAKLVPMGWQSHPAEFRQGKLVTWNK